MSEQDRTKINRAQTVLKEQHINDKVNKMTTWISTDRFYRDMKEGFIVIGIGLILVLIGGLTHWYVILIAGAALILTFIIVNIAQQIIVDPKLQTECFWLWGVNERFLCKRFCLRNGIRNHIKLTK